MNHLTAMWRDFQLTEVQMVDIKKRQKWWQWFQGKVKWCFPVALRSLKEIITAGGGGTIGKFFRNSWIISVDFCVQAHLVLSRFTLSCFADTVLLQAEGLWQPCREHLQAKQHLLVSCHLCRIWSFLQHLKLFHSYICYGDLWSLILQLWLAEGSDDG